MNSKFTKEELFEIKKIVHDYHQLTLIYSNYTKEMERIRGFLVKVEEDFTKLKNKEKSLLDSLHKKYGDFDLQDIYNEILNGTESGIEQCEGETGENTQV